MFYRAPGSIGASSFPSRVWKNQGMPGHMGSEKVTTKDLEIVEVRIDQNLLLIKGSVPGSRGSYLEIKKGD
jgi:large subunit ribosomal protein L3